MEADVEMNEQRIAAAEDPSSSLQPSRMTLIWHGLLVAWFIVRFQLLAPSPQLLFAAWVWR
jgi:hypothetical protein